MAAGRTPGKHHERAHRRGSAEGGGRGRHGQRVGTGVLRTSISLSQVPPHPSRRFPPLVLRCSSGPYAAPAINSSSARERCLVRCVSRVPSFLGRDTGEIDPDDKSRRPAESEAHRQQLSSLSKNPATVIADYLGGLGGSSGRPQFHAPQHANLAWAVYLADRPRSEPARSRLRQKTGTDIPSYRPRFRGVGRRRHLSAPRGLVIALIASSLLPHSRRDWP